MDGTYIKVKGAWKCLCRAVDKKGRTVNFLLTARRDKAAALRFFEKAVKASGIPEKVTMDQIGANKAAIDSIEFRHVIRKGMLMLKGCIESIFPDQFYALAGKIRPV
jgi:transposase-like protein